MRMPNGYGSVYKKSGKRRRPYVARKTIGWKDNGHPIYLFIGSFITKKEALEALSRYNEHPYDVGNNKYTFSEVYEKMSAELFPTISESNINGYKAAYGISELLYDIRMSDIKLCHIQEVADESGKNYPTLKKYRTMLNKVFDYAIKHEYIDQSRKSIIQYLDIDKGNPNSIKRKRFSQEEIKRLLSMDSNEFYMIVLIMIYSGVRINELLALESEDVHLDERYFYVDKFNKTKTGIREVPISKKIIPYIEHWLSKGSKYLICNEDLAKMSYSNFRDTYWDKLIPDHLPHDTRHTCTSLLAEAEVDERWQQAILGHKGRNVTERVYTHIDLPHKIEAIDRI